MEKPQGRKAYRIVLVPYPFQGHINPMLQLGTVLHSEGFSITVVHPQFNSPNPSNHPDFTFKPISDGLSPSADFMTSLSVLNTKCRVSFSEAMKQLTDEKVDDKIFCIIFDGLMYFTQQVAAQLKIPTISLRTSSAASVLAFAVNRGPNRQGHIPFQDLMSLNESTELNILLKNLPNSHIEHTNKVILEARAMITDALRSSAAVIVNTMEHLEQTSLTKVQKCFSIPVFPIGPFHKFAPESSSSLLKEDTDCITWLDKQAMKSVLYISFGSQAKTSKMEFIEIAWGLANSEQRFLWVVRPGSVQDSEWVELLPQGFEELIKERGRIVKWAPQKEVLAHNAVGGFWTHAGWNSILESICEGVPMLCRSFMSEQCLNARYVSQIWKVGLELDNGVERGEIDRAIRKLMGDKEAEKIRLRALAMKEKAELLMKNGKNSSIAKLVEFVLSF